MLCNEFVLRYPLVGSHGENENYVLFTIYVVTDDFVLVKVMVLEEDGEDQLDRSCEK